jgi:hypothetical protein
VIPLPNGRAIMKKIVIIVNKKWEAAPILGVFKAPYSGSRASARPFEWTSGEAYPSPQMWPDPSSPYNFEYRYLLTTSSCRIECWCLADFEDTSDSGKKSVYIPKIVAGGQPDLVVAIGTAASLVQHSQGSVIVGCRAFMHDPKINPAPTQPEWPGALLDKMMPSAFEPTFSRALSVLPTAWHIEVRKRILRAVAQPSEVKLRIDAALTTVADVNVADYTKYKITDPQTVDACKTADPQVRIGSIDTTLALIRAKTDPAPFLFVSGIANELGFMNRDVTDTEYPENFVASHNAGVVVAWLLPILADA